MTHVVEVRREKEDVVHLKYDGSTSRSTVYAVCVECFGMWLMIIYHMHDSILVVEAFSQHESVGQCIDRFYIWLRIPRELPDDDQEC